MNCIIIDDEKLSCKLLESFVVKTNNLQLIGAFYNPIEALNNTDNFKDIDLVFLDVELPEMTGIDVLSSITPLPKVIVMSSNNKYAVDAFDFNVLDFLLKPIKYPRFLKAIAKTHDTLVLDTNLKDKEITDDGIFIKKNNSFFRVKYDTICFIESVENYITIHTFEGVYTIHETLKSIEAKIPSSFWRIHRSYIVNINNVKIIEDTHVSMVIDTKIHRVPIGKMYKEALLSRIKSFK